MEKETKAKELIKKYLPVANKKEVLVELKRYSDLISSGVNQGDELVILLNLLNISGIKIENFQKDMRELKISYTDIYKECLNLEKEL